MTDKVMENVDDIKIYSEEERYARKALEEAKAIIEQAKSNLWVGERMLKIAQKEVDKYETENS